MDIEAVHNLFGSFRAEWLKDDIFQLFSEPEYFPHLLGNKSCVLMGGRGSGKTTVLRCLSYEGQYALGKQDWKSPTHVGVYYRINTNVVTAFTGPEMGPSAWRRLFGHFLNLTISAELAKYLEWHQNTIGKSELSEISFQRIALALGLGEKHSLLELQHGISQAMTLLEIYVNNLEDQRPTISQLQSPIAQFLEELKKVPGHEETAFLIVLDEYENLLDYQQKIINTMIKHSGHNYYFKIGVRELGWRVRTTVNDMESLISPADYELIHIEDRLKNNFADFARTVCESRLRNKSVPGGNCLNMDQLLPTLTVLEESQELGAKRRVSRLRRDLVLNHANESMIDAVDDFPLYVFYNVNNHDIEKTISDIEDYVAGEKQALNKYHNYAYALLFTLADRGAEITKHYCGHSSFARMASCNIRFYMQLIHECIVQQIANEQDLTVPIDCRKQTLAARNVGLNYLRELEGATSRGGQLSKMILGFGRFFQILASAPLGSAPECNQFHLRDPDSVDYGESGNAAEQLLKDGVMHLALVRSPGTKLATVADTRAWDYSLHPIFSAYFNYSSRRKRKITISDQDIIAMTRSPRSTIRKLLGRSREHLVDTALPQQMSMFDEFFR